MADVAVAEPAPSDEELWAELREVCERLSWHKDDLARRNELYEELRDRGAMLKDIAEVAGVTEGGVSFILTKIQAERAGTWDPKRRPTGKRPRRT